MIGMPYASELTKKYPKPIGLDRISGPIWRKTIQSLIDQGTWKESDLPLVERYVRSLEIGRYAAQERGSELTARGSQDQPVTHPLLKVQRDAEADAHRYAEALLLTPASRKRNGVKEGPSQDDLDSMLS